MFKDMRENERYSEGKLEDEGRNLLEITNSMQG